ncbi:MAG TPA: ABC transporter permease [Candidatus Saccharimonadales bacterium]
MMRSVYLKTLYEKRWFLLGWTLGFTALTVLMTTFYPAMHMDGALDALVKNMPKAFEGLIGDLANLKDFPSYIASQLFDIRLPLITGIMAIILGLGLSTNEEESGELRSILALPISRTKLLLEKWLALCTIMLVSSIGFVIGIYGVAPFIDGASIDFVDTLLPLVAMTWLLMVVFGTITFAAGMAFGKKGIANAVGILVIIGSFILSTFGQAVDWLEPFEKVSLLHYFPAVEISKGEGEWTDVIVLSSIVVVTLLGAWLSFRRRDIA